MFKLVCKNKTTGKINNYIYDRYKKSLYCSDTKQYLNYPVYSDDFMVRGNKWLYISLGTKCNLNCNYCIQSFKESVPDFTPNKVDSFLEILTNTINLKDYQRIYIWGGEPLVYRKTIRKLIPQLYNLKSDTCTIQTATNATLLTKDDIEFFIKYNVRVMISDDGINKNRFDGQKINRQLIRQYKSKGFNFNVHATLTPNNNNIENILDIIKDEYGDDVEFGSSIVYPPVENYDAAIFDWDDNSLNQLESHYTKLFQSNFTDHDNFIKFALLRPFDFGRQTYSCRFGEGNSLIVDVNGDMYSCNCVYSPNRKLGNLKDYAFGLLPNAEVLQNKRKKIFIKTEDRNLCHDCLLKYVCRGRCSTIKNDAFVKLCKSSKVFWMVAFKAALLNKFGLILLSYEKI